MSAVHSQSHSVAMTVISANVESLTASKAPILSAMCKEQHGHCLRLQETHRSKDQARPRIPGMALVAERSHNKHGSSVFIRDGLKVNTISVGMVVCNTFFKKEDSKLNTYQSGDNRSMIDYLMVRKTDRCLVKDAKVISSKECVPHH